MSLLTNRRCRSCFEAASSQGQSLHRPIESGSRDRFAWSSCLFSAARLERATASRLELFAFKLSLINNCSFFNLFILLLYLSLEHLQLLLLASLLCLLLYLNLPWSKWVSISGGRCFVVMMWLQGTLELLLLLLSPSRRPWGADLLQMRLI